MALLKIREELIRFDWHDLTDFQTIGSWPPVVRSSVLLLAFLLCVALGYRFAVSTLRAELDLLMDEQTALRHALAQNTLSANSLAAQRAATLSSEAALTRLQRQLPDEKRVPALVDDIAAAGLGSHLIFSRVSLEAERVQEFYVEQPVYLEVSGTYHDFASFISGLGSLPHLVTLHDFSIERTLDGLLRMAMTLQAHHRQALQEAGQDSGGEGGKEGGQKSPVENASRGQEVRAGLRYAGASLRSPFSEIGASAAGDALPESLESGLSPDAARPAEPLEGFALSALRMVGTIAHGSAVQALIRDERGTVHRIAVGQHLGRDHGKVQQITSRQMDLVEIVQSGSGWLRRPRSLVLQPSCQPACAEKGREPEGAEE